MLAGLLAAWAITAALTGDHYLFGRLGIYVAPWLMFFSAGLVLFAALARAWAAAGTALLVAGGLLAAFAPQLMRSAPTGDPIAIPGAISVLTLSARTGNADMTGLAATLKTHRTDIIALQEVHDPAALLALLGDLYGTAPLHHCGHRHELILSRFPVGLREDTGRHLFCTVSLPGGPVRMGSLHMTRPGPDRREQDRDYDRLERIMAARDTQLILAGDFNTTPLTTPYRRVAARLTNAFAVAGRGIGATYPTAERPLLGLAGPLLAIDHIFADPALRVLAAEVLTSPAPGADHFPVRAVLLPGQD